MVTSVTKQPLSFVVHPKFNLLGVHELRLVFRTASKISQAEIVGIRIASQRSRHFNVKGLGFVGSKVAVKPSRRFGSV
jgi:transcriptional regulator GlxA family with amidase domain